MLRTSLGRVKYQFFKLWCDSSRVWPRGFKSHDLTREMDAQPIWPALSVCFVVLCRTKPKVISGSVSTCHTVHSWQLHSAAQAAITMTWYPTQLHYPHTEPTSPHPILIMPSTWLWSNKLKWSNHGFVLTRVRTTGFESHHLTRETDAQAIRPSLSVVYFVIGCPSNTIRSCQDRYLDVIVHSWRYCSAQITTSCGIYSAG